MNKLNQKLLFSLGMAFLGLLTLGFDNAFAASGISSAVADDPDDADAVYSVGDEILITFPAPTNATALGTMTNGEIIANFTWTTADVDSDTLTGTWDATSQFLTIVVNAIGGVDPPIPNTDTVNYQVGTGKIGYAGNNTEFTADPVTLTGDFGLFVALVLNDGGGSGCGFDCEPPTLGVNDYGKRVVDNGFTYNGNPIDVEYYFTPYPLMTVNVADENVAEFKIYDNLGPDNIKHFELAFGLGKGGSISQNQAIIKWDKQMIGEVTNVVDPDNILENVRVDTTKGKCKADSDRNDCLIVTVAHTFRGVPDFNIVGTQVWDERVNSWQNFYNHGIEVIGESLNPTKEIVVLDHDGIRHTLSLLDKTTGIDENGTEWNLINGFWQYEQPYSGKIVDELTSRWYDRNHAIFATYKQGQALLAEQTLLEILQSADKNSQGVDFIIDKQEVPINVVISNIIQKAQIKYQPLPFELAIVNAQ